MNIKITRKQFLFYISGLIAFACAWTFLLLPAWQEYRVQSALERGEAISGDRVIQLIESANTESRKLALIEKFMLEHTGCCSTYDVFITPTMSSYGEDRKWSGFTLTELKPYLEFYVERTIERDTWAVEEASILLADYYATYESVERAIAFLKQKREKYMEHSTLMHPPELMTIKLTRLYVEDGQFEQAQHVMAEFEGAHKSDEEFETISYANEEFLEIKIEILLLQGKKDEAMQLLVAFQEQSKHAENYDDYTANERLVSLKRQLELVEEEFSYGMVSGELRRDDGSPIEGAEIYLRQNHDANASIRRESERYRATTDQEGRYQFMKVMPDEYQVGIGFTYEQIDGYSWPVELDARLLVKSGEDVSHEIVLYPLLDVYTPVNEHAFTDDKLTFSWEEDPKASSYGIQVRNHSEGGYVSQTVKDGIVGPSTTIDIKELYHFPFYASFDNDVYNEDWFNPQSMLAFANPNGQFSWAVISYDENGHELRRSFGYRLDKELTNDLPFFQVKQREASKADQLLLAGKVDQALVAYERDMINKEGIEKEHALIMAVKLLQHIKTQEGDDDKTLRLKMKDYIEVLYEMTEKEYYAELLAEAKEMM